MVLEKIRFKLKFIQMMESEPTRMKNGAVLPTKMIDFLADVLDDIRRNKPEDFSDIQAMVKKKELSRQEREALIALIFGDKAINRTYGKAGFDSLNEKLTRHLRCFFDEKGNLVDPRQ